MYNLSLFTQKYYERDLLSFLLCFKRNIIISRNSVARRNVNFYAWNCEIFFVTKRCPTETTSS